MESRKPKDPENKLVQAGLLLDIYGALLTERQRQFMRLHYEQDLSFSEIAREYRISRQAVHDSVKHATETLLHFENVLRLVEKGHYEGSPVSQDEHIGGRQLIERLENLERRIRAADSSQNHQWIAEEIGGLISLLQGSPETAEPVEAPAEAPSESVSVATDPAEEQR